MNIICNAKKWPLKIRKKSARSTARSAQGFFMTDRSAARSAQVFFTVDRSSARSAHYFFCENRNPDWNYDDNLTYWLIKI